MVAEKIWHKSHHMYLPEITKTCFLGRPQKKLLEHNGCLHVAPTSEQRVTEPEMENVPSLENYFPKNEVLLQCFQNHWNNNRTNMFQHIFADLENIFPHWVN